MQGLRQEKWEEGERERMEEVEWGKKRKMEWKQKWLKMTQMTLQENEAAFPLILLFR